MQRNLHYDSAYDFVNGINISTDEINIELTPSDELYNFKSSGRLIHATINAIVGENGSGKSSIIDYIVRILNNLSAILLGEDYRTTGAEHLHYINGVYASLYILIENKIYEIECDDVRTYVTSYIREGEKDSYNREGTVFKASLDFADNKILPPSDKAADILRSFCYTIVTNYSLYAFNSIFFAEEATDYNKEELIRRRGKDNHYAVKSLREIRADRGSSKANESRSWLQGLFVKNDGYQAPIVIAPMRESGRIDIQKEYKLAKERMLSLVFMQDENGKHYFNRINGKLIIDSVFLVKDRYFETEYQNLDSYSEFLPSLSKAIFRDLFGYIKQAVINYCEIVDDDKKDHHNLVWIYIVQKLIKIVFTYPRYVKYRTALNTFPNNTTGNIGKEISDLVGVILCDHSHVTRKLYRSIYYLQFDHISKRKSLPVDGFSDEISSLVNGDSEHPYLPFHNDELLPPPVFFTDFRLYNLNDKNKKPILFNTLSSGEKQITYTLSSFYYHLANLDSVGDVHNPEVDIIQYKYVMAIFDEIELYFHPEMQRTFISYMLDGLQQMKLRNIEGIQILMATHSPFILSDIPKSNVLFLNKDGYPTQISTMCTFGANIHSMLKNSFFLHQGTMGAFAQEKINECLNKLNIYVLVHEINQILHNHEDDESRKTSLDYLWASNARAFNAMTSDDRKKIESLELEEYFTNEEIQYKEVKNIISLIQDPLLKQILEEQLSQWGKYVALEN